MPFSISSYSGTGTSVLSGLSQIMNGRSRFFVRSLSVSSSVNSVMSVDISLAGYGEGASSHDALESIGMSVGWIEGWIECDDDVPTSDDPVLVCRDGDVSIETYWGDGCWSISPAPTHWRPLPSMPQEKTR